MMDEDECEEWDEEDGEDPEEEEIDDGYEHDLLLPEEAAAALGLGIPALNELVASDEIKGVFITRRKLRIPARAVEEYRQRAAASELPAEPFALPPGVIALGGPALPTGESGVYFLYGAEKVKIGFSIQPALRIMNLQLMCPVPLRLIGWIGGEMWVEQFLHHHLCEYREHGEWFTASPAVLHVAHLVTTDPALRRNARRAWIPKYRVRSMRVFAARLRRHGRSMLPRVQICPPDASRISLIRVPTHSHSCHMGEHLPSV